MANPTASSYAVSSTVTVYAGSRYVQPFDGTTIVLHGSGELDSADNGKVLVVELHGSGGQNYTTGTQYSAAVSGLMSYSTYNALSFSTVKSATPGIFLIRPNDDYGTYPSGGQRQSMWLGFKHIPGNDIVLITQRRLEAMLSWADANLTQAAPRKRYLTGGSMGGWGTLLFGLRRPKIFPAIYPDRPRWRYDATIGEVAVADWTNLLDSVPSGSAPNLSAADGGGSVFNMMDHTTYVSNTSNKIPWIGWCVGRQDGYTQFQDHVDAVAAMRAAKRGFAFSWNNGNHSTGPTLSPILASYPYGTFELGVGYPLFTNHSGDSDPSVDLVGDINVGLSFRNVVESVHYWSCQVTSILGARTVTVEPISHIFKGPTTPQTVSIPAANSWVTVAFTS
jgi:hypothetical protein